MELSKEELVEMYKNIIIENTRDKTHKREIKGNIILGINKLNNINMYFPSFFQQNLNNFKKRKFFFNFNPSSYNIKETVIK